MKTEHEIYPYRMLFHFLIVSTLESDILRHILSWFSSNPRTLYPVLPPISSQNQRAKISLLLPGMKQVYLFAKVFTFESEIL
jgi:hypothetical protein